MPKIDSLKGRCTTFALRSTFTFQLEQLIKGRWWMIQHSCEQAKGARPEGEVLRRASHYCHRHGRSRSARLVRAMFSVLCCFPCLRLRLRAAWPWCYCSFLPCFCFSSALVPLELRCVEGVPAPLYPSFGGLCGTLLAFVAFFFASGLTRFHKGEARLCSSGD